MSQRKGMSRRIFLNRLGATALSLAVVPLLDGCDYNFIESIRASGVELPFVTESSKFYVQFGAEATVSGWEIQDIKTTDWKLQLEGFGFDKEITFDDLKSKMSSDGISVLKTMRCVFDTFDIPGLLSNGVFKGVPLRLFLPSQSELEAKGVKRVRIFGSDGFRNNITLDRLFKTDDPELFEPLLVTELNGEALPQKLGAPVRLIIQEAYGYKNVKWIQKIEFTDKDEPFGDYQDNGYIDDGVLRVTSKVTTPTKRSDVPQGSVKVMGVAFSGQAGISKVEVSIDKGPFQAARIVPLDELLQGASFAELVRQTEQVKNPNVHAYPFRGVWAPWEFDWEATPGEHEIRVRATDRANQSQPETDDDISDGTNRISITQVTSR